MTDTTTNSTANNGGWRWLQSVGPGLITACVVIGPGSILTSSKVGAAEGYSKAWVVAIAVFFMLIYTTLAAKLGMVSRHSTADLVSRHAGRPLAVLIGAGVFFISAAFQFGNNLGVHSALSAYIEFDYWIVLFNAGAIAFVFGFQNLYRNVERLMACLVGLMFLSFATNLAFAQPNLIELAAGFIPISGSPLPSSGKGLGEGASGIGLPLLGLVGTTFVISAAYYQSYLIRFKGWTETEFRRGLVDARVSAILMALITLMIMSTAAAVLRGENLTGVSDVAEGLRPLFGEKGRAIFCLGLFAAAFSSFVVNSMIGGFILSDVLKLGATPKEIGPRLLTAAVLLTGMFIALYAIKTGTRPVQAIVAAQAVTVLASPLMAGALWWLTNLKSVMGEQKNSPALNVAAGLGFVLLLLMAAYTAIDKVWPAVQAVFLE